MNQQTWSYVDNFGKKNVIGIAHGADTGHLVVYYNSNIVIIDFKVMQEKTYSFFVGEEMVEIFIKKIQETFRYDCKINTEADTPLNRRRKETAKEDNFKTWAVAGLFALFLVTMIGFIIKSYY